MFRLALMLALLVPSLAMSQSFGFGPGSASKVLGAALPACTATITSSYIVTDPVSATTCAGGGATPYEDMNYCVCDLNTLQWSVLSSTLALTGHGDGTNAAAGNAILGVDESGNAQGAFDVQTDAEATAHAVTGGAHHTQTVDTNAATVCTTATDVLQGDGSCVENAGGGAIIYEQEVPLVSRNMIFARMNFTSPTVTSATWGFKEAVNAFGSEPTPPGFEPDIMIGYSYNMDGPDGPVLNKFEHACNWRKELAFRETGATSDRTYLEDNINCWPPDNRTTVTDPLGGWAPVAGDAITFSDTDATAIVLSWADPVLEFRMDGGGDPGALDTMTIPSGTAKLGATVLHIGSLPGHAYRPYQFEWDTYSAFGNFKWRVRATPVGLDPGTEVLPMRMQATAIGGNAIGFSFLGNLGNGMQAGTQMSQQVAANFVLQTGLFDNAGGSFAPNVMSIRSGFDGTNFDFSQGFTMQFKTPLAPGDNTVFSGRQYALEFLDQKGYGIRGGASIMIRAQTCGDWTILGVPQNGCQFFGINDGPRPELWQALIIEGMNWDSGHIAFVSGEASGDHLWADQTNEVLRYAIDHAPTSETDGDAILTDAVIGSQLQAWDTDLDDLADGSLSGSKVGTGISGTNISAGTVADARIDAALARDADIGTTIQAWDTDLDDLADGSLSGSKVGTGISGTNISTGTVDEARIDPDIARDSEIAPLSIGDTTCAALTTCTAGSSHWDTTPAGTVTPCYCVATDTWEPGT